MITTQDVAFFDRIAGAGIVFNTYRIGRVFGESSGVVMRRWQGGTDTLPQGSHLESVDRPRESAVWVVKHGDVDPQFGNAEAPDSDNHRAYAGMSMPGAGYDG